MKQRPYHVLVAEDHPLTRHEVVSVLQQRDYSVLSVASPLEAAQTLKRWPVDLLITGTRMGSWYGLQVILTGRATQPDLAAIIVSDGDGQMPQLDAGRHRIAVVHAAHRFRRVPRAGGRTARLNPAPAAMAAQTSDVGGADFDLGPAGTAARCQLWRVSREIARRPGALAGRTDVA